jgi:hypothetical protein
MIQLFELVGLVLHLADQIFEAHAPPPQLLRLLSFTGGPPGTPIRGLSFFFKTFAADLSPVKGTSSQVRYKQGSDPRQGWKLQLYHGFI